MKYVSFFFIIFLLCHLQSVDGHNTASIERLLLTIEETDDIKEKANAYFDILDLTYPGDLQASLTYESRLDSLLLSADFHEFDDRLFLWKGALWVATGRYEEGMAFYDQAQHLFIEKQDTTNLSSVKLLKSEAFINQNQYADAMRELVELDSVLKNNSNYYQELGNIQCNIALIYKKQQQIDLALKHLEKALYIFEEAKAWNLVAHMKSNMGSILVDMQEFDRAIAYHEEALAYYQSEGLEQDEIISLLNISSLWSAQGQDQKALDILQKAVDLSMNLQVSNILVGLESQLSNSYVKFRKYQQAYQHALKAYEGADSLALVSEKSHTSLRLARIEDSLQHPKAALRWLKEAYELQESINQSERQNELRLLQTKYQVKEQQKDNEMLRAEKEARKVQHYLILFALIFLSVITVFLYRNYRRKARINQVLISQKQEISQQGKQLQEQHVQLINLDQEKNFMVGMLAHDIRNPLAQIEGLADLLFHDADFSEENKRHLLYIKQSAQDLTDMSQRLLILEASEIGTLSLELTEISLQAVIKQSILLHEASIKHKNLRLVRDFVNPLPSVLADEKGFLQVLNNLLSNAIKFSPLHREISMKVEESLDKVYICISDQGPGIKEEEMAKLFQKYQKLSSRPTDGENSTGLGLALAQKYMQAMHGEIICESTFGKGSTFTICLPKA